MIKSVLFLVFPGISSLLFPSLERILKLPLLNFQTNYGFISLNHVTT